MEHTIVAAEVDIVANLDCACPVEAGSVVISFRSIFCIADINLIIGAACAARPGTEVEVIAILDNRSVNLAVNTSHHIRDRRELRAQIRNGKDLAARAGQPLAAGVVVILADNADVENARILVQIRRGELEATLGVQRRTFVAIGCGAPNFFAIGAIIFDDLCAVCAAAVKQNIGIRNIFAIFFAGLHDRDVVNAVPTAAASQRDCCFRVFGRRGIVYFGIVVVVAAVDVPCCECCYAEQHCKCQENC